jgi:hypothetical protein
MEQERFGREPTRQGFGGWTGRLTVMAALGAAMIMALTPLASAGATPNFAFKGATVLEYVYHDQGGCAQITHSITKMSAKTGLGRFDASAKATSCTPIHGGNALSSDADQYAQIGLAIPVPLHSTSNGVSLTWSIKATASDSAVLKGSTVKCPTNYDNFSYSNGTTLINFSESYSDCYVEAGFYLDGSSYLIDETTHTYISGTGGSFYLSNSSGYYHDAFAYSYNYSNHSDWRFNSTYHYSNNQSYGSGGSLALNATPTTYFNGTFSSLDKYILFSYIYNEVYAEQYVYRGTVSASLNAATLGNHEDATLLKLY